MAFIQEKEEAAEKAKAEKSRKAAEAARKAEKVKAEEARKAAEAKKADEARKTEAAKRTEEEVTNETADAPVLPPTPAAQQTTSKKICRFVKFLDLPRFKDKALNMINLDTTPSETQTKTPRRKKRKLDEIVSCLKRSQPQPVQDPAQPAAPVLSATDSVQPTVQPVQDPAQPAAPVLSATDLIRTAIHIAQPDVQLATAPPPRTPSRTPIPTLMPDHQGVRQRIKKLSRHQPGLLPRTATPTAKRTATPTATADPLSDSDIVPVPVSHSVPHTGEKIQILFLQILAMFSQILG